MSLIDPQDTIVAIASPTTPAPRGIVRLSGPDTIAVLSRFGIDCSTTPRARRFDVAVRLGTELGEIPVSVMLWPDERSYTGQPSAELHTFGSLPLLEALVNAASLNGARPARPGEFTMRAFLAGKLDLTQAEAVLGVIEAEGRGSLDHALRQLAGNLSRPLEQMRDSVLNLLADVEAGLDFVDEDIEFISDASLIDRLSGIAQQLAATREILRDRGGRADRPIVTLRGEPNAGKSCLINSLAGKEVAIVADVAGTTRDAVTIDVEIEGHPLTLVDTAGMERASTEVSRQAQHQADRVSDEATLRLWCVDSSRVDFDAALARLRSLANTNRRPGVVDLWIATKSDLRSPASASDLIVCSAATGVGIDQLRREIAATVAHHDSEQTLNVVGTAARCHRSLEQAQSAVEAAIGLTRRGDGHEFVSAELRVLASCLGEVTGAVYTDDILDRVFGRFCIGK